MLVNFNQSKNTEMPKLMGHPTKISVTPQTRYTDAHFAVDDQT